MTTVTEERPDENALDLSFTRDLRKRIITELTIDQATGKFGLPEDVKEQGTLLKALDGIDKAALGKMRIKVEDKAATSASATAATIAEMYKEIGRNQGFRREGPAPEGFQPPSLPEGVTGNYVPGQTAISPPQGSYDDFINLIDAAAAQAGASPNEAP